MPAAAVILDEIGKVMKEIGRPHNQDAIARAYRAD